MAERKVRPAALLVAYAPSAAMLLASAFTVKGAAGVFQADLVALVVVTGLAALAGRRDRWTALAIVAAALLCMSVHLMLAGGFSGASAVGLLVFACGVCASGLAAVGRALGAHWLTAGALSAAVLWIAMTGLFWADPMAERLPREHRFAFKQATLYLDLATACAYDGAGFDRFHDDDVYADVPLASSIVRAPAAVPTAAAWLGLGLLAWALASLLGADATPK